MQSLLNVKFDLCMQKIYNNKIIKLQSLANDLSLASC